MTEKLYVVMERTNGDGTTTTWIRWKDARSALKLQELVKERMSELSPCSTASDEYDEFMSLQSLVEESQK